MTQYNVDIALRSTGTKQVKDELSGIGKEAQSTSSALDGLKGILAAVASAFAVGKLIEYADGYATLQARLKAVSKDAAEYATVSGKLTDIANESRSGIEETANLYAKLRVGTQGLSFSTDDLLKVTGSLQKTFALSGATAEQTRNALIQLNQGLGAGALRGEEFNAVQEATQGEFGRVIESAGLASGSIRQLADNGQLSADLIVKSFQKASADLDTRFSQIPLTVGQAFTVLQNAVFNFVGQANQASGITQLLASGLVLVAENINLLVTAVVAGAAAWTAYYVSTSIIVPLSAALTTASQVLVVGLYAQVGVLATLRAAWIALAATLGVNPFVLLVTTIVAVGVAIYGLIGNLNLFGTTNVTISGIIRSTWQLVVGVFQLLGEVISAVAGVVADFFSRTGAGGQVVIAVFTAVRDVVGGVFNAVVEGAQRFLSKLGELITSIPIIGPYFQDLGDLVVNTFKRAVAAIVEFTDYIASLLDKLGGVLPAAKKLGDALRSFGQTVKSAGSATDNFGASLKKTQNFASSLSPTLRGVNDNTQAFTSSTYQATDALGELGDAAQPAFISIVNGATNAVSAIEGLQRRVGGLKSGLGDFGSGGKSVNGLSNASSLGGFTINTLPPYDQWLKNFGANPRGNAVSAARLFYDYARALTNVDTGGKLPQATIDSFRSRISNYKQALTAEEIASLGNMWDSLQKFRSGGSFVVGGSSSTDSNLVMLRATKGERVDVTSTAQQAKERQDGGGAAARSNVIKITINTPDADSFRRSGQQVLTEFANRLQRATNA